MCYRTVPTCTLAVLCYLVALLFVDEFMPVFYFLLESLSTSVAECGCKLLTVNDYISLLWTSAAEFPGEFQITSSKFHMNFP